MPYFVGSSALVTCSMSFSVRRRYSMSDLMVTQTILCSFASSSSSVVRIIVPSSRIISQQRPASVRPARRHRSTVASVCPARTRTPPSRACNGNMCPGRRKSIGFDDGSAMARAVMPRSTAEMPVVVEIWSTLTVKAVWWLSLLCVTICGRFSRSQSSRLIGIQMSPFAKEAIRFTFSVVANCAAQMRSPSFSRSGSSITNMHCPCLNASRASSIVLYCIVLFLFQGLW